MIDPRALIQQQSDAVDAQNQAGGQDQTAPDQTGTEAFRAPSYRPPAISSPRTTQPPVNIAGLLGQGQGTKPGFNMDTLMPILMLAAPFIEARNPGAGLAMATGVMNYQRGQAEQNQRTVLGLAHEFANVTDEQWPAVDGLLESMNIDPKTRAVVKALHDKGVFQDPNLKIERNLNQILGSIQQGQPLTPEQMQAARMAGLPTAYQAPVAGQPGIAAMAPGTAAPTAGGILRESPATTGQAAVPAQPGGVVVRPPAPTVTYGELDPRYAGSPIANVPIPPNEIRSVIDDVAKRSDADKAKLQAYLRSKLVGGLQIPGSVDLATLRGQMEAAGMPFAGEFAKARTEVAKTPVPVQIGGQTMMVSPDKAADLALKNEGMVLVRTPGGVVRMTGAEFASYQTAQARLGIESARNNREAANAPPAFVINGVRVRNISDLKIGVASGKIPLSAVDPVMRDAVIGRQPTNTAAVQAHLTALDARIQGQWTKAEQLYPQNVRDAMYRAVHNQAKPGDDKLLTFTPAGAASARAYVAGIRNNMGQRQVYQGMLQPQTVPAAKPSNKPTAGPSSPQLGALNARPHPAPGTIRPLSDGSRWQWNGTAWVPVP